MILMRGDGIYETGWALAHGLWFCPGLCPAGAATPCSLRKVRHFDGRGIGDVLYAHHAEEERPIASTTKLMTALVALESTPDLETVIKVRPEWHRPALFHVSPGRGGAHAA